MPVKIQFLASISQHFLCSDSLWTVARRFDLKDGVPRIISHLYPRRMSHCTEGEAVYCNAVFLPQPSTPVTERRISGSMKVLKSSLLIVSLISEDSTIEAICSSTCSKRTISNCLPLALMLLSNIANQFAPFHLQQGGVSCTAHKWRSDIEA